MFELIKLKPTELWVKDYTEHIENTINIKYKNINGLLVLKRNKILYENYYNGYDRDSKNNIASVTKSFISALIGIAINKKLINSVNDRVLDYFPEYKVEFSDFIKKSVTIKNLLTMTAPFPWKVDPLDRLRRQKNWVNYILDQLGSSNSIGKFKYNTGGTHILSALITKVSGMSAREFANENLFNNIGIEYIPDYEQGFGLDDIFAQESKGWLKDPQGITIGGFGLNLTVRELARFGLLYLNNGKCNNNQVITTEYINESIKDNDNNYGYLWWLINEDNIKGYMAAGSGGNFIFCFPELEAVVVVVAKVSRKRVDVKTILSDLARLFSYLTEGRSHH